MASKCKEQCLTLGLSGKHKSQKQWAVLLLFFHFYQFDSWDIPSLVNQARVHRNMGKIKVNSKV
jgi:hypothetical protein